jgi:hypothetical protein
MSALKKGRSEARPRADVGTRGRVRELFSIESWDSLFYLSVITEKAGRPAENHRQALKQGARHLPSAWHLNAHKRKRNRVS